jgi:hypothetical protein
LTAVALQLQPGWGQFLDDCRLRLPPNDPLNNMSLEATAELAIDRGGTVGVVHLKGSGNADFDRAVQDAINDAALLPTAPDDLISDDDRVHVRWLFARDSRQAGPATARLFEVELPLKTVIPQWLENGEVARAARRIAREPVLDERTGAMRELTKTLIVQALGVSTTRVDAIDAMRRAHVDHMFRRDWEALLAIPNELEFHIAIVAAASQAGLDPLLVPNFFADLHERPLSAVRTYRPVLASMARIDKVSDILRDILDDAGVRSEVRLAAIRLLELTPALATERVPKLDGGDARQRAAVCEALGGADLAVAAPRLARGLRDGDATVRRECVDATVAQHGKHADDKRVAALVPRIREIARDRDDMVRARAVAALVALDPDHAVRATGDASVEVRAAYARALDVMPSSNAPATDLGALIEDRDPEVRAAAWTALASRTDGRADVPVLATHAIADPAATVRRAAVTRLEDDTALARLASSDDDPGVRTEALVHLAQRRGRAAIEADLLARIAAAPPGSAERVRAALAWLLAK